MSIEGADSIVLLKWGESLMVLADSVLSAHHEIVRIDKLRLDLFTAIENPRKDETLARYAPPDNATRIQVEQIVDTAALEAIRNEIARTIRSLASCERDEYLIRRKTEAQRLGMRVAELDRLVDEERGEGCSDREGGKLQGHAPELPSLEPWPEPVSGTELLDDLVHALKRFAVLPAYAAEAIALWVMFAHAIEAADHAPRLMLSSPEKRCGKTLVLKLLSYLTPRPILASNTTSAALFRVIEQKRPTLLIDEADSFARGDESLRNVINSGHQREAAYVLRCSGEDNDPRAFSTWCPMALSGIGKLPGTIEDRSIIVSMKRKLASERVERFSPVGKQLLTELTRKIARWTLDHLAQLKTHQPQIPDQLNDRAADNWRLLLSIADIAGGDWPRRARAAALTISAEPDAADVSSLGVQLLTDVREILAVADRTEISSTELCVMLCEMEVGPWNEVTHGRPLSPARLARMLGSFGVHVCKVLGGKARGYRKSDFAEAFERYIPPQPAHQSVKASEPQGGEGETHFSEVSGENPEDTLEDAPSPTGRTTSDTLTLSPTESTHKGENPVPVPASASDRELHEI